MATSCYEYACGRFANNLELMMGLFNCYVREYSFVKQQQVALSLLLYEICVSVPIVFVWFDGIYIFILLYLWQTAIKMYKLVGEERFLLWAVCSIQLQVILAFFAPLFLCIGERILTGQIFQTRAIICFVPFMTTAIFYWNSHHVCFVLILVATNGKHNKGKTCYTLADITWLQILLGLLW